MEWGKIHFPPMARARHSSKLQSHHPQPPPKTGLCTAMLGCERTLCEDLGPMGSGGGLGGGLQSPQVSGADSLQDWFEMADATAHTDDRMIAVQALPLTDLFSPNTPSPADEAIQQDLKPSFAGLSQPCTPSTATDFERSRAMVCAYCIIIDNVHTQSLSCTRAHAHTPVHMCSALDSARSLQGQCLRPWWGSLSPQMHTDTKTHNYARMHIALHPNLLSAPNLLYKHT